MPLTDAQILRGIAALQQCGESEAEALGATLFNICADEVRRVHEALAASVEPYGQITTHSVTGQQFFYRWPQSPYLDNASECVKVYTSAPPSPASVPDVEALHTAVFTVLEGFTLPHDVRKILEKAYYAPSPAQAVAGTLTGCNCRWDGETQVEWCELHLAHTDAIHEWAERARAAEKKLATKEPK